MGSEELDYLDRLARMARRVRFDDLSPSAVAAAKAVVLDTVGAICAGSRLDENVKLADLATERSGHRTATLIGHARKAEPMFATLANATAGERDCRASSRCSCSTAGSRR